MANWTPDGFIGQLFKTIGKHVPPPAGVSSPALWGTRARIAELFERAGRAASRPRRATSCSATARPSTCWRSSASYYGPVLKAFAALEDATQPALAEDLIALIGRFNRADDGSMVVPSEYLEVVIIRK